MENFEPARLEIIFFDAADVLTASNTDTDTAWI